MGGGCGGIAMKKYGAFNFALSPSLTRLMARRGRGWGRRCDFMRNKRGLKHLFSILGIG